MAQLRFGESAPPSDLRQAVLECGRICYARGLMTSNDGNISVRLSAERILITASGVSKGRMQDSDLLVLDLNGTRLHAGDSGRPSTETPMHLEVYRQRPAVRAVIHAHPVFATALSVAGLEFPVDVLPEVMLTLGEVPTAAYATPSSSEDADAVRELILNHDAILLRQHGSLTVGRDLEAALIHLERLEHVSEVFWRAQALGRVNRIPPEAQARLADLRKTLFPD